MRNHVLYAVDDVECQGGLYNGAKIPTAAVDSKFPGPGESQSALQAAIDQVHAWW